MERSQSTSAPSICNKTTRHGVPSADIALQFTIWMVSICSPARGTYGSHEEWDMSSPRVVKQSGCTESRTRFMQLCSAQASMQEVIMRLYLSLPGPFSYGLNTDEYCTNLFTSAQELLFITLPWAVPYFQLPTRAQGFSYQSPARPAARGNPPAPPFSATTVLDKWSTSCRAHYCILVQTCEASKPCSAIRVLGAGFVAVSITYDI